MSEQEALGKTPLARTIYVYNLPKETTTTQLFKMFSVYGEIERVHLCQFQICKPMFASIVFRYAYVAANAVENFNHFHRDWLHEQSVASAELKK